MKTLKEMSAEVDAYCADKGWREKGGVTFGERIALLHSEVSEALEAWREWGLRDATHDLCLEAAGECLSPVLPKPEGVGAEFADVLIRLLDDAFVAGIDLEAEYERKMTYNRTRPYRHGGKPI